MANTGYSAYTHLEQYDTNTGIATGVTKLNIPGDPDYVAPTYNPTSCPLLSFYPISGCYWYTVDDEHSAGACLVTGSETYYSVISDGWDVGDVVYKNVGGVYTPISSPDIDTNTAVSYTRGGVREWVIIEGFTGVVLSSGACGLNMMSLNATQVRYGAEIYWSVQCTNYIGELAPTTSNIAVMMEWRDYQNSGVSKVVELVIPAGTTEMTEIYMFNAYDIGFPYSTNLYFEVYFYSPTEDSNWNYVWAY